MTDNINLKFLDNVPEQNNFGFSNGKVAHNIVELLDILKTDDGKIFKEHVDETKNNFANWIKYSVAHVEFADKIAPIKDRDQFLKLLEDEINSIKNPNPAVTSTQSVPPEQAPPSVPTPAPSSTPSQSSPQSPQQVSVSPQAQNPVIEKEEKFESEELYKDLIEELEQDAEKDEE